jgi:hypothetical protein
MIAGVAALAGGKKKKSKKPLLPTDEELALLCLPIVDLYIKSRKDRQDLNEQFKRVMGLERVRQFTRVSILDKEPRLARHPRLLERLVTKAMI